MFFPTPSPPLLPAMHYLSYKQHVSIAVCRLLGEMVKGPLPPKQGPGKGKWPSVCVFVQVKEGCLGVPSKWIHFAPCYILCPCVYVCEGVYVCICSCNCVCVFNQLTAAYYSFIDGNLTPVVALRLHRDSGSRSTQTETMLQSFSLLVFSFSFSSSHPPYISLSLSLPLPVLLSHTYLLPFSLPLCHSLSFNCSRHRSSLSADGYKMCFD